MASNLFLFSFEQGNFLIRLLMAHVLADFVLQSSNMVKKKEWISKTMLAHITIVFAVTFALSFSLKITVIITLTHWLIDSIKKQYETKYKKYYLFLVDQLLHLLVILIVWLLHFNLFDTLFLLVKTALTNYQISLLLLGYAFVIWPLAYILRFALQSFMPADNADNIENAGKLIGQFERIIILTFVLLNQYEAIGFLITGKSLIRFARNNEKLKSEYVLLGTMMSYALSIIIGVLIKWLLKI